MAENYVVNYDINVRSQHALNALRNFQQATTSLTEYRRYLEKQLRETVLKQQADNYKVLIEAGQKVDGGLGVIYTETGQAIHAFNEYGDKFPEALMLYYVSDREIETVAVMGTFKTKTVCFIDIVASVSLQSSKNLVLTQVQGRDFTRKELISGGDLTFSVNGKIVGGGKGIYPDNDVKKFIQIMQYGGVIKVNHFLFKQFNVEQIIIKDFNLNAPEVKNVQPYSFTCVAVEPDEDVIIEKDTIRLLNNEITTSPMNAWYKLILNNKLSSITSGVTGTGAGNATQLAATGLDALVPNI